MPPGWTLGKKKKHQSQRKLAHTIAARLEAGVLERTRVVYLAYYLHYRAIHTLYDGNAVINQTNHLGRNVRVRPCHEPGEPAHIEYWPEHHMRICKKRCVGL